MWQVDKKLHAARKRCSSKGWTTKAEISLLCEFWSRLANGEPSYRFDFNGFKAKAVNAKLKHMESVLDDPKLFQMPCATPEKQQGIIISYCKLLADSEGKAKLGKEMEGAEGYMWSKEDGAMQQWPNGLSPPCSRGRTAQLSTLPLCLTISAALRGRRSFDAVINVGREGASAREVKRGRCAEEVPIMG